MVLIINRIHPRIQYLNTTSRNYIAVKQSNICILICSSVYSNTRTRIYIVEIVGNIILPQVQLRSEYLQVSDRAHEHSCGNVNSSLSRDHHVTLFVTTLLSFPQCCRTILCFLILRTIDKKCVIPFFFLIQTSKI